MQLRHEQLLHLIQLCDSTLPTGGFAHSAGLEVALQLGALGEDSPHVVSAAGNQRQTLEQLWAQLPRST